MMGNPVGSVETRLRATLPKARSARLQENAEWSKQIEINMAKRDEAERVRLAKLSERRNLWVALRQNLDKREFTEGLSVRDILKLLAEKKSIKHSELASILGVENPEDLKLDYWVLKQIHGRNWIDYHRGYTGVRERSYSIGETGLKVLKLTETPFKSFWNRLSIWTGLLDQWDSEPFPRREID